MIMILSIIIHCIDLFFSHTVVAWLNKRENDHLLERGGRHGFSLPHSHSPSSVPLLPSSYAGVGGSASNVLSSIRAPAATVGSGMSSPQPPLAPRYSPITSYAGMQLHSKVCMYLQCNFVEGEIWLLKCVHSKLL